MVVIIVRDTNIMVSYGMEVPIYLKWGLTTSGNMPRTRIIGYINGF